MHAGHQLLLDAGKAAANRAEHADAAIGSELGTPLNRVESVLLLVRLLQMTLDGKSFCPGPVE